MHGGELPTETRKNYSILWSYKLQVVGYGEPNEFTFSGRARNALNYEVIFQVSPFIFLRFYFQECVSVYISMCVIMVYACGVYTHMHGYIYLWLLQRPEEEVSFFIPDLIFLRVDLSLTEPGGRWPASFSDSLVTSSFCFWIMETHTTMPGFLRFHMGAGIWAQVLMLVPEELLSTEPAL